MALLTALHVDGYPSAWKKGATLMSHLDSIITSTESYRKLLELTGDEAQLIIEAIQWVRFAIVNSCIRTLMPSMQLLNFHPSLQEGSGKRCPYIQALVRLAGKVGLVPQSYRRDVFKGKVVLFQSPVVDIFKADRPGHGSVCLKKYRTNPVTVDSAKRVCVCRTII